LGIRHDEIVEVEKNERCDRVEARGNENAVEFENGRERQGTAILTAPFIVSELL